ncbi:MAG: uroporphyrinogen decarboxylase family protein [Armatimonadia bacterium]
MTSKERVATALKHQEPDRVPLMEFAIDYTIIEDLLGHETFWRAHFKEMQAYWDGRRDEIVESQKRDIVQFAREFGQDGIAVNLVPPKGFQPERLQQLDEETWRDWQGNVYRYSALTHDLGMIKEKALDPQPAPDLWEAPAEMDESEWELIDYVLQELGDTHYIMARPGRRASLGYVSALGWEPMMMRLAEDPEGVREGRIRGAQNLDWDIFFDRGCDNLAIGEDFGHNHGPFMSPATFERVYVPSVKIQCEEIHEHGVQTLWHACGDNRLILGQMIDAGIDCYQAIQPEEDIAGLRGTWGHRLALWGGISTHTLVCGGPEEIRQQVREAVAGCAPGGGYVAGASHSVCVSSKAENYLAAIDELSQVGGY